MENYTWLKSQNQENGQKQKNGHRKAMIVTHTYTLNMTTWKGILSEPLLWEM